MEKMGRERGAKASDWSEGAGSAHRVALEAATGIEPVYKALQAFA